MFITDVYSIPDTFWACAGTKTIPDSLNRTGLLFTNNKGDFGAISVTERSCAAPSLKVENHTSFCTILWCRVNRYSDRWGSVQVGAGTGIYWDEVNNQERGLGFSSPNPSLPTAPHDVHCLSTDLSQFRAVALHESNWKSEEGWPGEG